MKRLTLALAFIALLSGCNTMGNSSEIVPIGNGAYSLAGDSYWTTDNAGLVRIELIKKANAFCKAKNKDFVLLQSWHKDGNFDEGLSATATINFRCE